MTNTLSFPTILVAAGNNGVRHALVRTLEKQGYLVLEADDGAEALRIVRVHSRPIQLMLTGENLDGQMLATTVRQYRRDMRVHFLASYSTADSLAPDLLRIEELLRPPHDSAALER
jgi:CheY-like chemotaxis protein